MVRLMSYPGSKDEDYDIEGTTYYIADENGSITMRPYDNPVDRLGLSIICDHAEGPAIKSVLESYDFVPRL